MKGLAIVGSSLVITFYCVIFLMSLDVEEAPTALHFATDASYHTSSLWLTSQLTEEIWNDA